MNALREKVLEVLQTPDLTEEELRRRVREILNGESVPGRMAYEEFLAWADEDTLAEWVNGEVVMYSPASKKHQRLVMFLDRLVGQYVEILGLGEIFVPPFQMKLAHSGREPDLLFVAKAHLDRLKETYLDGPADMVVEIISDESAGRDRGEKFYEYEEAGIPEYWLLDPRRPRAEFYLLDEQGNYRLALSGSSGKFTSEVLEGFWLMVEWLWQEPPPSPLQLLSEITGADPSLAEKFEQALRRR
ncbi:MAG: Uma2 family endonuclease [Calditrichaeota bacterium]|nr:MAG: Uma2 family endonuclease [Calditrichota bacterium]